MAEDSTTATIIDILEKGRLETEGLVPWGSNYTFLVHINHESAQLDAIYKPGQGERPLWDFARGTLCLRERAAFLVSKALGWNQVPATILRDGPHGQGSVQLFVEHDPQQHYLTIQGRFQEQVQRIVLLDVLINNADRKSGHVLLGNNGRLWAIDHGVCFHSEYKLRSVIWEFAGDPIPDEMVADLVAFQSWLCYGSEPDLVELSQLLDPLEMDALRQRLQRLIERSVFPKPGPGRHYPWPLV